MSEARYVSSTGEALISYNLGEAKQRVCQENLPIYLCPQTGGMLRARRVDVPKTKYIHIIFFCPCPLVYLTL